MRGPNVVEIEVNRRCNRRCSYCPNSLDDWRQPEERIEDALFHRIIVMLAEINFSGRLSFHFFNEPLLHPWIEDLVRIARTSLPLAYIVLYTNGDLLDECRYQRLLAAGIDHFLVTRHGWDKYPERPFQFVQHPDNFALSGRGGTIANVSAPLEIACYGPSEMMVVTVIGDVVLCHEDANRTYVMGSLDRQELAEVWESEAFVVARQKLEAGCRGDGPAICHQCDNRLYPLPGATI